MKFITEEDLRDLYKKQPFTDYDLKEGERLTPGARQFLVDRGVDMYDAMTRWLCLTHRKRKRPKRLRQLRRNPLPDAGMGKSFAAG